MNRKRIKFTKGKKIDLVVLFLLLILASLLSFILDLRFIASTQLFFLIPSIYLIFREKKNIYKIIFASTIIGLFWAFTLDFIAEYNKVWDWAPDGGLLFKDKIFNIVAVDVLIWFFLWVFHILIFYEHFIDDEKFKKISHKWRFAVILGFLFMISTSIIYNTAPEKFKPEYPYVIIGFISTIMGICILIKKRYLLPKVFLTSFYFSFVYLVFEFTALRLDQWRFPAKYIESIHVAGVVFPMEEFVIWILLSSAIVSTYCEFFIDDGK